MDLDAPLIGSIDTTAPAPGADPAPVAELTTNAPAGTELDGPQVETPNPEEQKAEAPDESDRVIELSRSKREAERKAKESEKQAATFEASLKRLEPVTELFKLADTDPLAFVREVAEIVNLSPERILQAIQTQGAGGEAELTSEDRIEMLERKLTQANEPKRRPESDPELDAKAEQAKSRFVDTFQTILEAAPGQYPNASKDPDAPQAAFILLANHWTSNGRLPDGSTRPDYRPPSYATALGAVERALGKRVAPARTNTVSSGGLSDRTMGAVLPASADVVRTDEEIRADLLRSFAR